MKKVLLLFLVSFLWCVSGKINVLKLLNKYYVSPIECIDNSTSSSINQDRQQATGTVGILGGGIAGLYAAYMLEQAGVSYTLIEKSSTFGGRLRTRNFNNGVNDYHEFGAMRFPKLNEFWRFDDLFKRFPDLSQVPYYKNSSNGYIQFEKGKRVRKHEAFSNSTLLKEHLGINVTFLDDMIKKGLKSLDPSDIVDYLVPDIKLDILNAKKLLESEKGQRLKLRSLFQILYEALSSKHSKNDKEILALLNFMELVTYETGLLHTSAIQVALDNYVFGHETASEVGTGWRSIAKGSSKLIEALLSAIPLEKRMPSTSVTGISVNSKTNMVDVAIAGRSQPLVFSQVIITIPFPALHFVEHSSFSCEKKYLIRTMSYVPACKIMLSFPYRFWELDEIYGGESAVSLPSRFIIYPSHGVGGPINSNSVLLSYMHGQDAIRLGGLLATPNGKSMAINQFVNDLRELHGSIVDSYTYTQADVICWQNEDGFFGAYSWLAPSQDYHFLEAGKTDRGVLYFAGEHASEIHGWVAGALESSYVAVKRLLQERGHPNWESFIRNFMYKKQISILGKKPIETSDEVSPISTFSFSSITITSSSPKLFLNISTTNSNCNGNVVVTTSSELDDGILQQFKLKPTKYETTTETIMFNTLYPIENVGEIPISVKIAPNTVTCSISTDILELVATIEAEDVPENGAAYVFSNFFIIAILFCVLV